MNIGLLIENFFLVENQKRIDFLNNHFKDGFDTSHDTLAKHKETPDIINHFAKKGDPTTNKSHTQWILNQYNKKHIRQEDAPGIKKTLKDFDKAKDELEKKDINQYPHISDLRDAVASKIGLAKKKEHDKKKAGENKAEDLKQLYDKDGVTGFKIPNRESSIRNYGAGGSKAKTNWCTAANSSGNMFNHYKGGKYTMHMPNGHVLQFHHQSQQMMDEKDRPVEKEDSRYAEHMPHINEFLQQAHELEGHPTTNLLGKYKTYTKEEAADVLNNKEEAHKGYHPEHNALMNIVKGHDIPKNHLDDMKGDNKHLHLLRNYYEHNPHVSKEDAEHAIAHNSKGNHGLLDSLKSNMNRSPELLHHELDNVDKYHNLRVDQKIEYGRYGYGRNVVSAKHLGDEHHKKIIQSDQFSDEAKKSLASHDLSHDNQKRLLSQHPSTIAELAEKQSNLHPEILDKLTKEHAHISSLSQYMRKPETADQFQPHHYEQALASAKKLHEGDSDYKNEYTSSIASHIMHTKNPHADNYRQSAINLVHNNVENMDKANWLHGASHEVLKSSKLSKEDINGMWDKAAPGGNVRGSLISNAKIDPEKISSHIDDHKGTLHTLLSHTLENKKLTGEHLQKLLSSHHMKNADKDDYGKILNHSKFGHEDMNKAYSDSKTHSAKVEMLHHPKVTQTVMKRAVDNPLMHPALSSSPFASPSLLHQLSDSKLAYVRKNVANHKNTENETHKKLVDDSDPEVSAIANKKVK